jgi:FhaA, N-terminal domain/FHA domain
VSVLRTIEQKIEALVEGVFGRAFRASVQPVELARKLVKEMDDHRTVSVSRVYVPNEYTVYLSPSDRQQFSGYEESLKLELQDYLAEHARREGYVMLTAPIVVMTQDAELDTGEFGIATRMVQRRRRQEGEPRAQAEPAATMVYRAPVSTPADDEQAPVEAVRELVFLNIDGQQHELAKRRTTVGRSRDCDIQLPDPNVSRHHAEVRQEGATYWIVDLDSTNGTELNGERTSRAKLEDGDRITVGSTDLIFERKEQ